MSMIQNLGAQLLAALFPWLMLIVLICAVVALITAVVALIRSLR